MTTLLRTSLIVGGLLLAAACTSPVEIYYFSMEPTDWPAATKATEPVIERNIAVENLSCASALRKQEIVLRHGKTSRLEIDSHNQWWAFPNEMLSEALQNYLLKNRIFRHVLVFPTSYQVDYILEGSVKQFELCVYPDHWQASVALHFYLIDRQQSKIIWDSGVMQQTERCAPDIRDAGLRMGMASEKLFRQLEQKLRRLLASQGPTKKDGTQK